MKIKRSLLATAAFLGTSLTGLQASAMGYGMHPTPPMPPAPPMMGMMPYGMPGMSHHGSPMGYGGYASSGSAQGYGRGYQPSQPMPGYGTPYGQGYGQPSAQEPANTTVAATSGAKVNISQMRFEPTVIRVKAGESVTWKNGEGMPHTITRKGNAGPSSGTLTTGQAFSHTFEEAGTYEYYCAIHPGMTGTVVVE